MEPKLSDTNVSYHLPDEPSLTPFGEQKSDIPRIVPADFKAPPRVAPKQEAGAVKPAAAKPAPGACCASDCCEAERGTVGHVRHNLQRKRSSSPHGFSL